VPDLTIILAGSVEPETHDVAEGLIDPAAVARRSKGTMGQAEMLDAIQRGDVTLQFVAPAQIDGAGRINTSRVKTRRLPGPLALPDVAVLVGRLVAYRAEHSPRFLAPEVDYVTGAAGGVTRIVTGVAEIEPGEPARLVSLQPGADVETAVAGCGFPLARDDVQRADPIPDEACTLLRTRIDPHNVRLLELREGRAEALATLTALARAPRPGGSRS
jgi:glutaconate CoA-transferase subunit B